MSHYLSKNWESRNPIVSLINDIEVKDYKKSEAEIAEKKCTIIKNLRFWYSDLEKFNHIPKYINRLAPIVDLHANDGWEYPRIWTNFVIIWDWSGIDIEV